MNPTQEKRTPAAFTNAQNYFATEGLNFPYVTEADSGKFLAISQDIFGTYPQAKDVYGNLQGYVMEALSTPREYVLFGVDGHGINSKAMHYYAVKEHVAIFVQIRMGAIDENGNLEDPEEIQSRINGAFQGVKRIFDKMKVAEDQHLIQDGQRLLIVESDFGNSGWEWVSGSPGEINKAAWNDKGMTLLSALRAIPTPTKT